MRNLMISLVAVAALAGCGAVHRNASISASPDFDDARFTADQKACTQQSIGQGDKKSAPTWGQTINREAYNECMARRGWDTDALSSSPRR